MPNKSHQVQDFTDIPSQSWMNRWLPESWLPYAKTMRLDRPIGFLLLAFPGWWAIAMSAPFSQMMSLFIFFGLGAILMRGAGCAYNDWVDRDLDAKVTRTKSRPLASGQLSQFNVFLLIAGLLLLSFCILLSLPALAIKLGFLALIPVAIYPWMKRFTYWPQLFLGIAFNWGALMGWAASRGELSIPAWSLYIAGIFWTLVYDTIYAHQDKEDDLLIGIKSTALKFGPSTRKILLILALIMFILLIFVGMAAKLHWGYGLFVLFIAAVLFQKIARLNFDDPKACLQAFKQQSTIGWAMLIAIALGRIF